MTSVMAAAKATAASKAAAQPASRVAADDGHTDRVPPPSRGAGAVSETETTSAPEVKPLQGLMTDKPMDEPQRVMTPVEKYRAEQAQQLEAKDEEVAGLQFSSGGSETAKTA